MRNAPICKAERHRITTGLCASDSSCGNNGAFEVPFNGSRGVPSCLRVIASDGEGWDHVSVSLSNRTPTWEEMCFIKDIFFRDDEAVIQFHPPKSEYVNFHPFCLHLWRKQDAEFPLPPSVLVGPKQECSR
jgi:hypothetical protein